MQSPDVEAVHTTPQTAPGADKAARKKKGELKLPAGIHQHNSGKYQGRISWKPDPNDKT